MTLTDEGARLTLDLDSGAPDVPVDTDVVVAHRSAIGEQYIDLRPRSTGEPFLSDGDVLTGGPEALPPRVENLLSSVDELSRSVPLDALAITVEELGEA